MRSHHDQRTPDDRTEHVADIGGSHVTAAVVERGDAVRILARAGTDIDTRGEADALLAAVASVLRGLAPDAPSWTLAMPGPFDNERGIGTFEGVAKFGALAGIDLREAFASRLGLDRGDVRFLNDAVAYGIGEWAATPGRPDRFVCVTLGTGVGSAFLDRGAAVETGAEVPPHGWAHLLEIGGAPLEDSVSTRAIQRRYREAGGESLDVRGIAERARHGEDLALSLLETAMAELSGALLPWVARFQATELVVGGSMARSWDVLGPAFARGFESAPHSVAVRPSQLLGDAPLIGAAVSAARPS